MSQFLDLSSEYPTFLSLLSQVKVEGDDSGEAASSAMADGYEEDAVEEEPEDEEEPVEEDEPVVDDGYEGYECFS